MKRIDELQALEIKKKRIETEEIEKKRKKIKEEDEKFMDEQSAETKLRWHENDKRIMAKQNDLNLKRQKEIELKEIKRREKSEILLKKVQEFNEKKLKETEIRKQYIYQKYQTFQKVQS